MHETMAGKDMYSKLWNVVRMLLVLSHGQAAVEDVRDDIKRTCN